MADPPARIFIIVHDLEFLPDELMNSLTGSMEICIVEAVAHMKVFQAFKVELRIKNCKISYHSLPFLRDVAIPKYLFFPGHPVRSGYTKLLELPLMPRLNTKLKYQTFRMHKAMHKALSSVCHHVDAAAVGPIVSELGQQRYFSRTVA